MGTIGADPKIFAKKFFFFFTFFTQKSFLSSFFRQKNPLDKTAKQNKQFLIWSPVHFDVSFSFVSSVVSEFMEIKE